MNQIVQLQHILSDSPIGLVLPAIAQLNLPDWWLAGGAVRNTVWGALFGETCGLLINDFDIAFLIAMAIVLRSYLPRNVSQLDFQTTNSTSRTRPALPAGVLVAGLISVQKMEFLTGFTPQQLLVFV